MTSLWRFLLGSFASLFVLLLISIPYVSPGTATYYVSVFAGALLLVGMAGSSILVFIGWDPF